MKFPRSLMKWAGQILARQKVWIPPGPGPEAYLIMNHSVERILDVDHLFAVFERQQSLLEGMTEGCLEWLQRQIDDFGESSERVSQIEAITTATRIYISAWTDFEQAAHDIRSNLPKFLETEHDMPTAKQRGRIEKIHYFSADLEEKYGNARSAAIDLVEAVLAIVPENDRAAQHAAYFLARTEGPPVPDNQGPSALGSSLDFT